MGTSFQDIVWGDDDEKAHLARVAARKAARKPYQREDRLYCALTAVIFFLWIFLCLWAVVR